jgi:diguanylate cyclase (GGDEF)-like protein
LKAVYAFIIAIYRNAPGAQVRDSQAGPILIMELSTMTILAGAVSAIASILLGVFAFRRGQDSAAALPFALLMLANAVYAAAYAVEINSGSLEAAIGWIKVEYIGVTFVPVFWFLFARAFVNESRPMSLGRLALLSIVPAITLGLMWTNEAHGLVYESLRLREGVALSVLVGVRGPWYWVNTAYLYILMMAGTIAIVAHMSRASGKFRGQVSIIGLAVVLPWFGHALLLLNAGPWDLDLTPFLLAASGAFFAWGIFKYSIFDLAPIARELVVDAMRDGVIVLDRKGRFVDANKAAKAVFPGLAAARIGSDAAGVLGPLGIDPRGGAGDAEFSLVSGGAVRYYRAASLEIRDEGRAGRRSSRGIAPEPRGTVVIVSDTTETRELLGRLERLVATDELTKVDNRRRFFEHAERELELARRQGSSLSFAMLDLDHFKRVNDGFGHAAGDAALVAVCGACRAILRSTDILCRLGGEEFIIILPGAGPADAMEIVERARRSIAEARIPAASGPISVTASFGVAGSEGTPDADLETYLRRCDEAMYRAKGEGRNRVELYREG